MTSLGTLKPQMNADERRKGFRAENTKQGGQFTHWGEDAASSNLLPIRVYLRLSAFQIPVLV